MSEPSPREKLDRLLGIDVSRVDDRKAVAIVGHIIDLAGDLRDSVALDHALASIDSLQPRDLSDEHTTLLHYFEGNAWSVKTQLRSDEDPCARSRWDAADLGGKILAYRRAVRSPGFEAWDDHRKCQVLTNLGNSMSNLGRFVEAIDYWDRALALDGSFGMAIGGKGYALVSYLRSLYDPGHKGLFAGAAHALLSKALKLPLEGNAPRSFRETLDLLERNSPAGFFDGPPSVREFKLGRSKTEQTYRSWCLDQRLFVNPLNDVIGEPIAATDALNLPSLRGPVDEMAGGRASMGLFNVLKQEFVAARTLLWEGIAAGARQHFADREVNLMDTLDGARFGFGHEKIKLAFRSCYSILDRVGFLVNLYFKLGIPLGRVNFRSLWYRDQKRANGIRSELVDRENWPLRGLFWLSKDLDGSEAGIQECVEPEAQALQELRNHLTPEIS